MYVGTLMFVVLILKFFMTYIFGFVVKLCIGLIDIFVAQTFGMGTRWYISGHAPWSDAYESYFMCVGYRGYKLAFGRKSNLQSQQLLCCFHGIDDCTLELDGS